MYKRKEKTMFIMPAACIKNSGFMTNNIVTGTASRAVIRANALKLTARALVSLSYGSAADF